MSDRQVTRTTVPAQPGWFVAIFIEKDKPGFAYDPIVAWEIERVERDYHPSAHRAGERCVTHHVIPLTTENDMENHANMWAIKRPDGKYEIPGDTTCDTEADALAEVIDRLPPAKQKHGSAA
jgi:hypothetical protein